MKTVTKKSVLKMVRSLSPCAAGLRRLRKNIKNRTITQTLRFYMEGNDPFVMGDWIWLRREVYWFIRYEYGMEYASKVIYNSQNPKLILQALSKLEIMKGLAR